MTDPGYPSSEAAVEQASSLRTETEPPRRRRGRKGQRIPGLWRDVGRDLLRNPVFVVSALVALAVVSMAALPWLWTNTDPRICSVGAAREGPSAAHPFGTTVLGCDMYARVVYGARPSILIGVLAAVGTAIIGVALGTLAAFYGGKVDTVLSRFTDVILGLPFLLAALLILSLLGSHSLWLVGVVLIVFAWTQMFRIMRGSVLATQNADYVTAARAQGASDRQVICRHILPNAIAPAIVISTIGVGVYVSAEATLTYLGVGLQPSAISWGVLISEGQSWAVSGFPHLLVFPCAFLLSSILAFMLMGDALRDALDPTLH